MDPGDDYDDYDDDFEEEAWASGSTPGDFLTKGVGLTGFSDSEEREELEDLRA